MQGHCIRSMISIFSNHFHTRIYNILIVLWALFWFLFIWGFLTSCVVRFFALRVINVNVNIIILHENNLLIEITFAWKCSTTIPSKCLLTFWDCRTFCLTFQLLNCFRIFKSLYFAFRYWKFLFPFKAI